MISVILIATKTHSLRELRYNTHTHNMCILPRQALRNRPTKNPRIYVRFSLDICCLETIFNASNRVCVGGFFFFDAIYIYVIVTCVN